MNKIFWAFVAVDATLFLILLVATVSQKSSNDGGKEMALFFTVLVPGFILALAVALYYFSHGTFWRGTALLILAGPGLFLCGVQLRNAYLGYVIREMGSGRGYFSGSAMKQMGEAVVKQDPATINRLAPRVNLNAEGERGMTLLRLAVEQSNNTEMAAGQQALPSDLPIIAALLANGAQPNAGMETATKLKNPEILRTLLEAGADANFLADESPVAFSWLNVMPAQNMDLLIRHGLEVNETNHTGVPLVLAAGQTENWNAVLLLLEHGADPLRADRHGLTLVTMIPDRIDSYKTRQEKIPDGLLKVQAVLPSVIGHETKHKEARNE